MNKITTTPLNFDATAPVTAEVENLINVFTRQIGPDHPGGQLVVLHHGRVVVDLAAGQADQARKIPVRADTPFLTFSLTKPLVAVAIHQLIEQGRLSLDAPVADYWPEFGCKGKETATIRHTLLHQAGIPLKGMYSQTPLWLKWGWVCRNVARTPAEFPPGQQTAYHLVNGGFILGEVIRRVTGQPVAHYLHDSILAPLGLTNSYLGLSRSARRRTAQIYSGCVDQNSTILAFRLLRQTVVPSATLHSTAREVAIFYQMLLNGGRYGSQQILQPETIEAATTLAYSGYDGTLDNQVHIGYGFALGGRDYDYGRTFGWPSTRRTFGHLGQRSCMAWADKDHELVCVFLCNRLLSNEESNRRWCEISDAVWAAVDRGR